jgi:cystathionine beta-lyase/cystathionine gamma-synthase
VAEWLSEHPAVGAVHYPGLAIHPQHDLAKRQMRQFGTVLAFDLAGGTDAVRRLIDRIELARPATSLGGPETLLCHPRTTTHAGLTPDEQAACGVTDGLVRLTVGLEDAGDLVADLTQALG